MEKQLSATYWKEEYLKVKALLDNAEQIYTNIGYSNCREEYEHEIMELKNKLDNYSKLFKNLIDELSNDVIHTRSVKNFQEVSNCCSSIENFTNKDNVKKQDHKFFLYAISMTEYERGWGQRPDGTVYTFSLSDANEFIKNYLNKQPKDHVPDCYTMPSDPKPVELAAWEYKEIVSKMINKDGIAINWVG